jgi:hypothetical protein
MDKDETRLRRQLAAVSARAPGMRQAVASLLAGRLRFVRIPVAIALMLGGVFAILPVLGLWMLPLGLLLLAVDVPRLQPWINAALIRSRRRVRSWRAAWAARRQHPH